MADPTFRPERRPVDGNTSENMTKLNDMAKFRQEISTEVGETINDPNLASNPNVPQAFLEAQNRVQQQNNRGPRRRSEDSIVPSGTGRLEELLKGIRQQTSVYEEIELPSLGKFYDGENGPKDGIIHIRPMTGEEEQILATPRFVKKGQAINMIFNRCIQENFNSENFITPDRTYLLIYLRGISYTPQYDVEVKCPNCDRKFGTTINLNDLMVDTCPNDFGSASLIDTLPNTKYKFRYRLSSGMDEQQVQDYRDRRIKGFESTGLPDDTLSYRTAILLDEIEGLTNKTEIQQLLKHLPINDLAYLRTVVNEPPFGVDTKIEIPCPACLSDFEIELPLEANFFFPKARRKTQNTTQA